MVHFPSWKHTWDALHNGGTFDFVLVNDSGVLFKYVLPVHLFSTRKNGFVTVSETGDVWLQVYIWPSVTLLWLHVTDHGENEKMRNSVLQRVIYILAYLSSQKRFLYASTMNTVSSCRTFRDVITDLSSSKLNSGCWRMLRMSVVFSTK